MAPPPRDPTIPPWAGAGETRAAAIERLLAVAREHDTHDATAAALRVSWRTVARYWEWFRKHAPEVELPARPIGGTTTRGTKAAETRKVRTRRIARGSGE